MDRDKILMKYGGSCAYCGDSILAGNFQVDHLHPRNKGGKDDEENLMPSCRSCNATKSTYTLEEFRQRLIDDMARLDRDSSKFRILKRFGIFEQVKNEITFYFEEGDK